MFSFKTINKNKINNYKACYLLTKNNLYSCEDICKYNRLSYPCSIKTFDHGTALFPEVVVRVCNPLGVKRYQIAQFKGYFCITRHDPVENCLRTRSAYLVFNLFEINFFAAWYMLICKGWNLLVRLWGTITNSQLFFVPKVVSFHLCLEL